MPYKRFTWVLLVIVCVGIVVAWTQPKTAVDPIQALAIQVSTMNQHLVDMDHRLDIQRTTLDTAANITPEQQRLSKIEEFITMHNADTARQEQASTDRWNSAMSWAKIGVGALLGLITTFLGKWWVDHKHQIAVRQESVALAANVQRLEVNTNHKMDMMLQTKGEAEHAKGKLEGEAEGAEEASQEKEKV